MRAQGLAGPTSISMGSVVASAWRASALSAAARLSAYRFENGMSGVHAVGVAVAAAVFPSWQAPMRRCPHHAKTPCFNHHPCLGAGQ